MRQLNLEESLIVYNWFYKLGSPLISDTEYNKLFSSLKSQNPESAVITKTWSEMDRPTQLLIECGLDEEASQAELAVENTPISSSFMPDINMRLREEYWDIIRAHFKTDTLKSIESIESENASNIWLHKILQENTNPDGVMLNFSIKADGFSIGDYYVNPNGGEFSYFIGAQTRGRTGEPDDVSVAMSKVLPLKIRSSAKFTRVRNEAVMAKDSLAELKKIDPSRKWKSTRNSMSTLLLNHVSEEFHKRIIPLAFKVDGLEFNNLFEEFSWLEDQGFNVVYNHNALIKNNADLLEVVKEMSQQTLIYEGDGCVVTVHDKDLYFKFGTVGKYDFCQRAYRLYEWTSKLYLSIITGFNSRDYYNSKRRSVSANIIPTQASNGQVITSLDVDNLSRIEEADIDEGSFVAFWIRSDSCVDWLPRETMMINKLIKEQSTKIPTDLLIPLKKLQKAALEKTYYID